MGEQVVDCILPLIHPRMKALCGIIATVVGVATTALTIPTSGLRRILRVLVKTVPLSFSYPARVGTRGSTVREHHTAAFFVSVPSHGQWGVILSVRTSMIEKVFVMMNLSI